jgi:hypothetical protein
LPTDRGKAIYLIGARIKSVYARIRRHHDRLLKSALETRVAKLAVQTREGGRAIAGYLRVFDKLPKRASASHSGLLLQRAAKRFEQEQIEIRVYWFSSATRLLCKRRLDPAIRFPPATSGRIQPPQLRKLIRRWRGI